MKHLIYQTIQKYIQLKLRARRTMSIYRNEAAHYEYQKNDRETAAQLKTAHKKIML